MSTRTLVEPDIYFINYLQHHGGEDVKKCFQCASCSVVCSISPEETALPRKQMINAAWGRKDELISDPDVWLCHGCSDCSTHCPRGAKPADVLASVRSFVIENFAFPNFMGNALKSPKYLLPLLLVPFIILFALLYDNLGGNFAQLNEGTVQFSRFLPHGTLEMFWIGGNILIFSFSAVGLYRFWNSLKTLDNGNGKAFIPSLIETVVELAAHKKFNVCKADSARFWGHLLIFYGFVGAMITAGLAVMALTLFDLSPIPLFHPIKILGNASGIAMITGCIVVAKRRVQMVKEGKANHTYNDWVLVSFVFLVSLTGILTQTFRIIDIPFIAYNTYFVHMVFIFFLLWYAPYSKLGHMFYRTLAIVYLKQNGRDKKAVLFN